MDPSDDLASMLGPDLTSLSEEDLLRYFLTPDFEDELKVPSPLLEPPAFTLISPIPKLVATTQTSPVHVKKESLPVSSKPSIANNNNNNSTNNGKGKGNTPTTKPVTSLPIVKAPITNTHVITPVSLPSSKVPSLPAKFSSPSATKPGVSVIPTQQIHPITVSSTIPSSSSLHDLVPKGVPTLLHSSSSSLPISPVPSPSHSPLGSPLGSPIGTEDDKTVKRQRRLLKNRESAQLSRIRKKMYIDELERKVNALVSENTGLRDEVVHLNDVLKQVTNGKEANYNKGVVSRTDIMHSNQAKKYAGVCLLVVLFSLGLFLNVTNTNSGRVQTERLLELDNHHGNKNTTRSSGNDNNNNNHAQYRDFKLVKDTSSEHGTDQKITNKRAWENDADEYDMFPPSHKRTRTDYVSDSSVEELGDTDLFDVLEDDAFSDGVLTSPHHDHDHHHHHHHHDHHHHTSSVLSSPSSSAPASPVPSTPPFPTSTASTAPSSPTLSDAEFSPASFVSSSPISHGGQQLGVAVMMPHANDPAQLVHIHLWSVL